MIIAAVALVVDLVTALLTYTMSKSSMNMRAAFLHNVADALGSVAVIVAGTLIIYFDWRIVDPLVTLMIAGYILWQSYAEIGDVIRVLMLGRPPEIPAHDMIGAITQIDGVTNVHHAHLWQMSEHDAAFEAHVVVEEGRWSDADAIKDQIKASLLYRFKLSHTTLELECSRHACLDAETFGH